MQESRHLQESLLPNSVLEAGRAGLEDDESNIGERRTLGDASGAGGRHHDAHLLRAGDGGGIGGGRGQGLYSNSMIDRPHSFMHPHSIISNGNGSWANKVETNDIEEFEITADNVDVWRTIALTFIFYTVNIVAIAGRIMYEESPVLPWITAQLTTSCVLMFNCMYLGFKGRLRLVPVHHYLLVVALFLFLLLKFIKTAIELDPTTCEAGTVHTDDHAAHAAFTDDHHGDDGCGHAVPAPTPLALTESEQVDLKNRTLLATAFGTHAEYMTRDTKTNNRIINPNLAL